LARNLLFDIAEEKKLSNVRSGEYLRQIINNEQGITSNAKSKKKMKMSQVGMDDISRMKILDLCIGKLFIWNTNFCFDLSRYEFQRNSDWNRNMIHEMSSVENATVVKWPIALILFVFQKIGNKTL
jgi:hypothetical protein